MTPNVSDSTQQLDTQTPSQAMVETCGLTKRYGDFEALSDCSLRIEAGEVFGLLGPNGAGKTTFLRLLLGFLRPTSGQATVRGMDITRNSVAVRHLISYLPGDARLPRHLHGRAVLEFFSAMHPQGDLKRCLAIANQLDLNIKPRVAFMSTGMRQKLALAAILGAPTPLLILDEPTSNLDPTVRRQVLKMVVDAQNEGRTVIFSSHILAEIEEVCGRVGFLRSGRLECEQSLTDAKQRYRIIAAHDGPLPVLPQNLERWVDTIKPLGPLQFQIDTTGDLTELLSWLASLDLHSMRVEPLGLKTLYEKIHHDSADQLSQSGGK